MKEQLRQLKENGRIITTPDYTVLYNCFADTFILDIPEDRKILWFQIKGEEDLGTYRWDLRAAYPTSFNAYECDFDAIEKEMEPYIHGATPDLIPSAYEVLGDDYIWIDKDDNGPSPIKRTQIIPINQPSDERI